MTKIIPDLYLSQEHTRRRREMPRKKRTGAQKNLHRVTNRAMRRKSKAALRKGKTLAEILDEDARSAERIPPENWLVRIGPCRDIDKDRLGN
jgi:hypothetical protein